MLSAIVLAIVMLIYNPIQQQLILNQVKQIVIHNNELLLNQSKGMSNVAHTDQLQRQEEHANITKQIIEEENDEQVKHNKIMNNQLIVLNLLRNQSIVLNASRH